MTAINAVILPDAEKFLEENIGDFCPDGVSAIYPTENWANGDITLYDEEESEGKTFTRAQQVAALQKLADEISGKRLFVGGIENPADLADPCNWDVEVVDAFYQLIYHGEVIYG